MTKHYARERRKVAGKDQPRIISDNLIRELTDIHYYGHLQFYQTISLAISPVYINGTKTWL